MTGWRLPRCHPGQPAVAAGEGGRGPGDSGNDGEGQSDGQGGRGEQAGSLLHGASSRVLRAAAPLAQSANTSSSYLVLK